MEFVYLYLVQNHTANYLETVMRLKLLFLVRFRIKGEREELQYSDACSIYYQFHSNYKSLTYIFICFSSWSTNIYMNIFYIQLNNFISCLHLIKIINIYQVTVHVAESLDCTSYQYKIKI